MFWYKNRFKKASYSQCGEDCIIEHMFKLRGNQRPSYIDIGAFHPYSLSNTAKFYLSGSRGVNIEPNPKQYKYFSLFRRKDINLNIGIGEEKGMLNYFQMNDATMNTFDSEAAIDLVMNHGFKIESEKQIQVNDLKSVIAEYCNNIFPDFLSLDVEGLDEVILKQIDFENNYPKIICVETTKFTSDGTGEKNSKIMKYLESKDYLLYADTQINSIFVNRKYWIKQ